MAFGSRGAQAVVLKVVKHQGDEWHSGEVLDAFRGNGVVRVFEYVEGAALLERANPGTSLVRMALDGRDEDATAILAEIIEQMSGCEPPGRCATVQDWADGYERYLATGDGQIPRYLVEEGRRWYSELSASQQGTRLLHGDFHHYNVVSDSRRGWLAIDPKGVVGEVEYEIGAVLRNPIEAPELFVSPRAIERRLGQFGRTLHLNLERALAWGFAQAILSAIWEIEDGSSVSATTPSLRLANAIRTMLPIRG
jgi:streptomycin 6-kinase